MAITQIAVTATYKNPDGTAATGTVDFTPFAPLQSSGSNLIIPSTTTGTLAAGTFTVTLYATDDADTSPEGAVYEVVEHIAGAVERSYLIEIPNTGAVNLADIAPAEAMPYTSYATSASVVAKVAKAGDTMSGNLAMGSNKVTGLGAATTNGDALRYEQLLGQYLALTGGTLAGALAMGANKITGLGAGTTAGDALRYEQVIGLYALLTGASFSGTINVTSGGQKVVMSDGGVGAFAASADTYSTVGILDFFGVGALVFGAGGASAADWAMTRTAANTVALSAGDKLQQNTAPTTGDDLTNKTYVDGRTVAASTTVSGIVELAIGSEVTTGTDATRAVTPDSLAGSEYGVEVVEVAFSDMTTAITTGDGKAYFTVPAKLNGWNLIRANGSFYTAGSATSALIQIHNITQAADMLTTRITIEATEATSYTGVPGVVDAANDDVATGDRLRIDVDQIGTAAAGGIAILEFQAP